MSNPARYVSKSVRTAYIASVLGLSIVLFIVGLMAWLLLNAEEWRKEVRELAEVEVFFKNNVPEADAIRLEKDIKNMPFAKSADKITGEEAYEIAKADLGFEEADEILGSDFKLPPSIRVRLKEPYVYVDSVAKIKKNLEAAYPNIILEVNYRKRTFRDLEKYTARVNSAKNPIVMIGGIVILLLFLAIALIFNTIRLAIYSRRFSIKTMTLVGAKASFIRRPFLVSAATQGFVAGILALCFGILLAYLLDYFGLLSTRDTMIDRNAFIYIFVGLIVFGVLISVSSTFLALRKYIRIKTDNLY